MQYSIVVSIYYDAYLAKPLCQELHNVMSKYVSCNDISSKVELIFVNDGSRDDSIEVLIKLAQDFNFVRVIDLSRNFGQHAAIACGIKEAKGQVVLRMNVDMQDPPYEIPKLLDVMKATDCDLVVGQYAIRHSPWINRFTAYIYFKVFKFFTGFETPQNTSPLRAMNRGFVNAYNSLTEKSRFPQGLDQWLGFKHKYIEIDHKARKDNKSSYNLFTRTKLAINGLLYFSDRPLTLVVIAGFLFSMCGIALAFIFVFGRVMGLNFLPGYLSLISLGLIAFGLQLGCTGLVGLYVSRIFKEVQNRPLYIIRKEY